MDGSRITGANATDLDIGGVVVIRRRSCGAGPTQADTVPKADAFEVVVQLRNSRRQRLWRGDDLVHDGSCSCGSLDILDAREGWKRERLAGFDEMCFRIPLARLQTFVADLGRIEDAGLRTVIGLEDGVMLGLAQALLPLLDDPSRTDGRLLERILLAVLTHLTGTYGDLHLPDGQRGKLSAWQERRAMAFMVAHFDTVFSVEALATDCNLSRSYFNKAFKASFGCTPHRWLTRYRLTRVREMLEGDLPIAEIAVACGFSDQSHLTRVFSAFMSEPPGHYRERLRGRSRVSGPSG